MKFIPAIVFAIFTTFAASAVSPDSMMSRLHAKGIATRLDVGASVGTTGLGLELSTPVTRWTNVRAGIEWMPQFRMPLDFRIATYADGKVTDKFDKIQDMMMKITGSEMHQTVTVNAKPKMLNAKILVDVFPFQNNRRWHITAGVYIGGSEMGTAVNNNAATSTLVAMNIYNRFYDRLKDHPVFDEPFFGDIYLTPETYDELMSYGRMGIHIGDYKGRTDANGNPVPYYLTPTSGGAITARARTNAVKPYIGIGYSGSVDKSQRLNIGFEAGALCWGRAPQVILNDGTNMNKDLVNIRGKIGDYMNALKSLPVYPVVQFKISYKL